MEKSLSHALHLSKRSAEDGELGPDTTESSDPEPSSGLSARALDGLSDNHTWPEVALFTRSIFRVSSAFDPIGRNIFCLHGLFKQINESVVTVSY